MLRPRNSSAKNMGGRGGGSSAHEYGFSSESLILSRPASSVIAVAVAASLAFTPCSIPAFAAEPSTGDVENPEIAQPVSDDLTLAAEQTLSGDIETLDLVQAVADEVAAEEQLPDEAEGAEAEQTVADDPAVVAALATAGITVEGGIAGTDYTFEDVSYTRIGRGKNEASQQNGRLIATSGSATATIQSIVIAKDGTYTISSNKTVSAGIKVAAGVHANIILAGFNTTSTFPFNIETNSTQNTYDTVEVNASDIANPTTVNLFIAAGTSNSLLSNQSDQFPGLRCGEGSVLTIDSTVSGSEQGSLSVRGGLRAASIGGGPVEDAGVITINGGTIETRAYGPSEGTYGAGTGIGGGHAGGGTIININGGHISAYGSYHGAGIGGGCTYNGGMSNSTVSYPLRDALLSRHAHSTLAGDITITGGFIKSEGETHSNAFGQGCGGTNTGHIIRITGGTLLPDATKCDAGFNAIGGAGGYTIITGGSIHCTASQFQGIGNTAYNTLGVATWSDVTARGDSLPVSDQVFMTTVDLSSEGFANHPVTDWNLYIANKKINYGAPSYFDNGKLYLWLPKTAVGKEVRVSLKADDERGGEIFPGDLFIDKVEEGGNSLLKRFVDFEFPTKWAQEHLYKPYDGIPFASYDPSGVNALMSPENPPKSLNDPDKMKYTYQLYDADGEFASEARDGLPADAGHYQLVMTSTQYSDNEKFASSYWGHRAYGECEIYPVSSKVMDFDVQWTEDHQALTVSGNIMGADNSVSTYKYPQGSIQLLVDGKPSGAPIDLIFDEKTAGLEADTNTSKDEAEVNAERVYLDNYAANVAEVDKGSYTRFEYTFDAEELQHLIPYINADGSHSISMQYLPTKNYLASINVEDKSIVVEPADSNATFLPHDCLHINADGQMQNANGKVVNGSVDTGSLDKIELKLDNPSIEDLTVETNGTLCEADFVRDDDGNPVRDDDGRYTLVIEPQAAGNGKLTITQPANGFYTGTTFEFDVSIGSDAEVKPEVSIKNTTHPNGPVSKGDVLEYTVEITNDTGDSDWQNVLIESGLSPILTVDPSSIHINNPADNDVKNANGTSDIEDGLNPGEFNVSDDNKLNIAVGSIPAANGDNGNNGDNKVTVTFKVTVNAIPESEDDIANKVTILVTDPDGNVVASSDPTVPDTLPGGINPVDPGNASHGGGSFGGGAGIGSGEDVGDGSSNIDLSEIDITPSSEIRLDPDSTEIIDDTPYFEYKEDEPVNILDMIQVKPDDGNGWAGVSPSDPDSNTAETDLPDNVHVTVIDDTGHEIDPTDITDPGTYQVTITVLNPETNEFEVVDTLDFHIVDTSITNTDYIYSDVARDFWGHDCIFDIGPAVINGAFNPSDVALGYMRGYGGSTLFGTEHNIIRGDAAVVIWRMAGCPDVEADTNTSVHPEYTTGFADCDEDKTMYYNKAIAWCAEHGIVLGYEGTNEFGPQNNITREEFAAMLMRYASLKGKDVNAASSLSEYPDYEDISGWAVSSMKYVTSEGIVTGKVMRDEDGNEVHLLDPQAPITRAEVAKMTYVEQPLKFKDLEIEIS